MFTGVSVVQTGRQNAQQDDLTAQGQITDRYTAAVDQIGSPILDVRLGGIYALERIMRDSPPDQPTIVEVLSAFVRDHPPGDTKSSPPPKLLLPLPTDVAAALTVLGRRPTAHADTGVEDLHGANFADIDLTNVMLTGADLSGADLAGTDLSNANLTGTNLISADLSEANLSHANLSGANLSRAKLPRANLNHAYLNYTNLTDADLYHADLTGMTIPNPADLTGANMTGTSMCDHSFPLLAVGDYTCGNG